MGKEVAAMAQGATTRWSIFDRAVNGMTISLMETLDGLGYLTTGLSFLGVGMVVFLHAWYVFILSVGVAVIPAVLALIHDLLLVIILLELFRTIINFLKTKVITLEPFLYICVIASTRRILTTGAQIAYMGELTDQVFLRYLLDLGANVLVIVALVFAVYLARRVARSAAV
ncbi:phosphate-starvation-inducible PsiE family protein [Petrachloros mirabilis]